MMSFQKSNPFVIIGSFALRERFPEDARQDQKDIDVIISKENYLKFIKDETITYRSVGEYELQDADSAIVKFKDFKTPYEFLFSDGVKSLELILDHLGDGTQYATPEVLYCLKKAHINFPIKFEKHIADLQFLRAKLRDKLGITLRQDLESQTDLLDHYPALTMLHFQETERRRGKLRTPKMAEDRTKFFGKSKKFVTSYYVHDNMHLAMAHDQDPVYLQILKEGAEVETDPGRWSQLTIQQKIWCVLEEVYVIALERKVLPAIFQEEFSDTRADAEPQAAFKWALMRVCTTLCDGFFRDFAVRAYDQIVNQYDPNYVQRFFKNIGKYEQNANESC